jgi:hypothetical protein
MAAYFGGINSANYQQAWDVYSPALQATFGYQAWSSALSTSQDSQVVIQTIQHNPSGDLDASVMFQSQQAPAYGPNPGETCTNWSLDYQLISSSASAPTPPYLINQVTTIGPGHVAC